jgi:DNA-binding GntR family transcriptional regulator
MPTRVEEVADKLRNQILAGDFGKYGRLPSREELATQHNTSRDTINKAVALLQAEGLLSPKGQRGVVVSGERVRIQGITARFDLELEKRGLTPYEENIEEPSQVPAPTSIAQAMNIEEGTPVVRRYRRQGIIQADDKIPYRLAENFYPTTLVDESILEQMQRDEQLDVVLAIKEKSGKAPVRVHEDVIGRLPTAPERDLLQLKANVPLLEVRRINFAADDTVIMANKITFVANFFILSYDYPVSHWKN